MALIRNIVSDASAEEISSEIERAYLEFDREIRASGLRSGSTCSSVLMTPKNFIFANVGDSRTLLVGTVRTFVFLESEQNYFELLKR